MKSHCAWEPPAVFSLKCAQAHTQPPLTFAEVKTNQVLLNSSASKARLTLGHITRLQLASALLQIKLIKLAFRSQITFSQSSLESYPSLASRWRSLTFLFSLLHTPAVGLEIYVRFVAGIVTSHFTDGTEGSEWWMTAATWLGGALERAVRPYGLYDGLIDCLSRRQTGSPSISMLYQRRPGWKGLMPDQGDAAS